VQALSSRIHLLGGSTVRLLFMTNELYRDPLGL